MVPKNSRPNILKNEKGQSFLELILLMVVTILISFTMIKGINSNIALRWKVMAKLIAGPTTDPIEF